MPGIELALSIPIGIVFVVVARWFPLPSFVVRLIGKYRVLPALLCAAACTAYWQDSLSLFDKGLQGALVAYVVSSLFGASTAGPANRNVGAMLGLLLAGAYGGFFRSILGFVFGALIGWIMKTRSGAATGFVIGTLSSLCLMAPGCNSYDLGFGPVIETAQEQYDDMASGPSSGRAEDSVFYRGPFQDGVALLPSVGLWSMSWLFGIPFGVVIGTLLGELAKAGPLRSLFGAAATPPPQASEAPAPPADARPP